MKTLKRSLARTLIISTLCLIPVLTGCHATLVLPADRVVVAMPAGEAYTPDFDGYFVPKARMLDILDRLSEKEVFGQ